MSCHPGQHSHIALLTAFVGRRPSLRADSKSAGNGSNQKLIYSVSARWGSTLRVDVVPPSAPPAGQRTGGLARATQAVHAGFGEIGEHNQKPAVAASSAKQHMALSGLLPASVPDAYSTKTIEAAQKKAAADRLASNIRLCHGPQGAIEVPIAAPMRRRAARVPRGRGAAAKPTPSELAATERQPDGTGSKTGGRPLTPPRKPDPEQERAILEQQARLAEQQVRLAHDIEQRRQEQAEREEDQARKDAQERKLQELRAAMPGLDEETITKLALGPAGSGSSSPSTAAVAGGSSQEAEAQQVEESGPYSRTAIRNAQHRARIEREQKEKNAETVAAAKAAAKAQERAEALRHRRQLMEVRRQKMRQQQEIQ